jgi:hypothetical protein
MNEIMKVCDVFKHSRGLIITGVNPSLDALSREQINDLIGERIKITNPNGVEVFSKVVATEVSSSLIGKKNISILLDEEVDANSVSLGAGVISIQEAVDLHEAA